MTSRYAGAEELIRNDDPKFRISLDATVACYLTLKGAGGLGLVEDLFLKPKIKAEYSEVSSVIMAAPVHRPDKTTGRSRGLGSSSRCGWC